jgi:hypothetical protein
MKQFENGWTDFHEISYEIFMKNCRAIPNFMIGESEVVIINFNSFSRYNWIIWLLIIRSLWKWIYLMGNISIYVSLSISSINVILKFNANCRIPVRRKSSRCPVLLKLNKGLLDLSLTNLQGQRPLILPMFVSFEDHKRLSFPLCDTRPQTMCLNHKTVISSSRGQFFGNCVPFTSSSFDLCFSYFFHLWRIATKINFSQLRWPHSSPTLNGKTFEHA